MDSRQKTHSGRSLRKQLLQWLLFPLLGLLVLDTTIIYGVAMNFVETAFDRALYETAFDVGQIIAKSGEDNAVFKLPQEAKELLLSDKLDHLYYNVTIDGVVVAGEPTLYEEIAPEDAASVEPVFDDTEIQGQPVRVVSMLLKVSPRFATQKVRIQIAETLNKRHQYAGDILTAIVAPQLLLILMAAAIVWFGVGRGLLPMRQLQSAMASRSPRDLSPVSLTRAPEEASALVDSINYLLNQLEKVLETQNRFIADAAHQLRTPLAGIMAQLEVAQRERDPQELQISLAQMATSMERLSHLVNQLLALARNQPEAARTLAMTNVDLNELVQQTTIEMAPAAVQKEIDIGFEGPEQPCYVEGDAQRLREMLSNLIDNGIRYTQRKGKLTVSLAQVGGEIRLSVEDNGPGIPLDEQEKVFERFHRVVSGGYPDGSGLGLAIVREIAHIHNASVSLASGAGGKGTCVQIVFAELAADGAVEGSAELAAT